MIPHLLVILAVVAPGCQPGPEGFAPQLDAAMASGDIAKVLPLLTRRSRAVVRSLGALSAPTGSVAGTKAAQAFLPRGGQPTKVLSMRTIRSGGREGVVLEVRTGGAAKTPRKPSTQPAGIDRLMPQTQEWVLRQEDGAWRLDLLATADRRPL